MKKNPTLGAAIGGSAGYLGGGLAGNLAGRKHFRDKAIKAQKGGVTLAESVD